MLTSKVMKMFLESAMQKELENMCAYSAIKDDALFRYYAGRADSLREILEDWFDWCVEETTEHIKNMFDIMDKEWCKYD